ncbi:hypothetical protein BO70DRAFT_394246 [Aspergillus heteromorphus CBS 117.55]|uniref:Uncharacterized protein n=1 Tax=Aspergillus heteromorphus CBS 117.55 TaxID=1448321 RepID=A0A317WUL9_9EURO|nr:uncharacterized protein BO70DRAFT_394246 [Aspergillus heteromorphus CBS 117.55]PWY88548.1 hypothetical protein BO70DRAFT_394246 [Aspergillus heteromorphus CBS 117.55]
MGMQAAMSLLASWFARAVTVARSSEESGLDSALRAAIRQTQDISGGDEQGKGKSGPIREMAVVWTGGIRRMLRGRPTMPDLPPSPNGTHEEIPHASPRTRSLWKASFCVVGLCLFSSANRYDGSLLNSLQALDPWMAFMQHPAGAWLGFINAIYWAGSGRSSARCCRRSSPVDTDARWASQWAFPRGLLH